MKHDNLMEPVVERGNLWLAYDRVLKNSNPASYPIPAEPAIGKPGRLEEGGVVPTKEKTIRVARA